MNITDIAVEEYVEVDASTRLGKIRSIFEEKNPKGIVVTEDGEYAGVIGERDLIKSRIEDDTKASVVMKNAPRVKRTEHVREVARILVEGNVKIAPVYEGEKLYGIVTEDGILEAVLDNLDAITVEQIYTKDVVTITEEGHVGQAINRLRENGISRLPVLNENDRLTGVITTHDIVEFVIRGENRLGRHDRSGDTDRMLDIPVYDLMSNPVLTATPEETVKAAVERMFENDIAGLIVSDDGDAVDGVVTKTDVLRALTFTEEESMDVQITNIALLDTISREHIVESIESVSEKYQEMAVHHAHVRFHEHKEKLRGTPLLQCQIRLRTSEGQVAGSGEGYGSEHAFHVALDKLERNVLEMKGFKADEEYRGQLLRKLGEL
ncbi:Protein containing two CBS domains (some fused to C-terminal double-stranded RNA-binding domain of RaiA family) [Halalkaliarchaeum sp. AArc-CO]|uniref:CBS domain-containing protein n=1 Tax=unclassified Halalkaliarchaeum TaxID=2678344 RepID=UPI00217D08FA|nr:MULTISPECIES: CBS domain-containing protein [unclassified Halalkaliarchaeum]MDR5671828.1 CBS domain-containing protein [Halalkaliarchaeum sp. AArc-GB]UWG51331.1 Protein containing two CBS domains (some fused to C-terminal double-stranded RNA-binding domain of RaiA family) [Halalkaliarchaeum sp. AArc-CO]